MSSTPVNFRENVGRAIRDKSLRDAMRTSTDIFTIKRNEGVSQVPMEEWREEASAVRLQVLDNLQEHVDRFSMQATRAGAVVHRARDAQMARDTIFHLLKDRGAAKIVKAKSMITEEIHLNEHLQARGMDVVETDLGEYIVQLAGEKPSHILAPAIHKNRRQVGRLFAETLGVDYSEDPEVLTKIARVRLREKFLAADAGISGVNFAVAESGSIVIFTNEGNGRMVTTLPPLHIAVLSIEKMIPSLKDLSAFVRLLPRSATGQPLSSYVSMITGTRKPGESTGAKELHIVLLDNGRTEILKGKYREILKCIRCSTCINVCPVYRVVGGHAYDSTYSGPVGVILTALLDGMERSHPLTDASTLCGACDDACPVKVPLARLISKLREDKNELKYGSMWERAGMFAYGIAAQSPWVFGLGKKAVRALWPLLTVLSGNGLPARFPAPATKTFAEMMSGGNGRPEHRT
ncbi:MAG TPA: LutB/LldF family L-lactate oxidation iron-sulfur protein [Desulfomonilaceae bacterium]|nr:LutB/LldF family L-lactate oxidation iron-sulfur protein [Desulfomonilaceae bacterium]